MKRIEIDALSDLPRVAEEVINSLDGRTVVLLRGGMGAGKTTLVSRIAALLGAEDTVTSPMSYLSSASQKRVRFTY